STFTCAEVRRVMKTMRRGERFALESIPAMKSFVSAMSADLLHNRFLTYSVGANHRRLAGVGVQAAVFADSPEVNRDEEHRGQRKNHAVQHVEAQQCIGVDGASSEQQEVNLVADYRHGR